MSATAAAKYISHVDFVAGFSSFYFDDQQAIKSGARQDGFVYTGAPATKGFRSVRQAGECISVVLTLSDGSIAVGDCAAVQYSGAGGRDPLFVAADFLPMLRTRVAPLLEGRDAREFLANARHFDRIEVDGRRLHTAVRYGLSQAFLNAASQAASVLPAEIVCEAYGLPIRAEPIPLFGQSGDDRYSAVDKMILKRIDVLPHGLINHVDDKLGRRGEKLREYVRWLVKRVQDLGDSAYRPELHLDVYGTVGIAFDNDSARIADYLQRLEEDAGPLPLCIEGPVDAGSREAQIDALRAIRRHLRSRGSRVRIVADEWCNTYEDVVAFTDAGCCDMVQIKTPDLGSIHNIVESVLYCNAHDMQAYQGGTCNETDVSARACVHVALAARPMRLLVKPGMGFDEGYCIVHNEMHRSVAVLARRTR
ncbi:MAG TPA: methylaspartate ammonia-lyase [Ramlibacter sp.]|uniref:methylaspartate ammonia-lyase n=1 Tax=Ramlibacter sp. TaxID=1917967 RepID=UPI002BC5B687|nr:methylaspartate ammonia-lyase [Ramlibacter sp.]HVZ44828.1 methylaspartate ammonia-lyase [Ramlibacter sp.]